MMMMGSFCGALPEVCANFLTPKEIHVIDLYFNVKPQNQHTIQLQIFVL